MKCKTCAHPQCPAINQALLSRTQTLEALSHQYGLSVSSLHRHKRRLVENLDRARYRLRDSLQLGQLLKLNSLLDRVERAVDAAVADGDVSRIIRGASAGARIIGQMGRLEVSLDLISVHHLISSPQWVSQDSILPVDPQILAGIHQTTADIAFASCPEPDPERISASLLETRDPELETPPPCPDPDTEKIPATRHNSLATQNPELEAQRRRLSARMDLAGAADLETEPEPKREKSAKIPEKASLYAKNNQQNQLDNHCGKSIAPNPVSTANRNRRTVLETENQKPETIHPERYWDGLIPLRSARHYRGVLF